MCILARYRPSISIQLTLFSRRYLNEVLKEGGTNDEVIFHNNTSLRDGSKSCSHGIDYERLLWSLG